MGKGILMVLVGVLLVLVILGVIDYYRTYKNMKPIFVTQTIKKQTMGNEITIYKNPIYRIIHTTSATKDTWEFKVKIDNPAYEHKESYNDYK